MSKDPTPLFLVLALLVGVGAQPAQAEELERLFFANQLEDVEQQTTLRLRRAPGDRRGLGWRAEVRMKQGHFDAARRDLVSCGQEHLEGALAWGDFAWYTGDFTTALGHYRRAEQLSPDNMHARWGVASALLHLEAFDESLVLTQAMAPGAAKLDADFQAWVLVLEGASLGLKADKGSIIDKVRYGPTVKALLERALATAPKNANALSALGRYYYFAPMILGGDAVKAVELLDRANGVDPFFYLNHAFLIRALAKAGQKERVRVELAFYRAKFADLPAAVKELSGFTAP